MLYCNQITMSKSEFLDLKNLHIDTKITLLWALEGKLITLKKIGSHIGSHLEYFNHKWLLNPDISSLVFSIQFTFKCSMFSAYLHLSRDCPQLYTMHQTILSYNTHHKTNSVSNTISSVCNGWSSQICPIAIVVIAFLNRDVYPVLYLVTDLIVSLYKYMSV